MVAMEELLLGWYSRNGRDLPWRATRDPYAILVSEVMLQQNKGIVAADPMNPA
jgi:A/G-specific adenine glycosylase